MLSNYLKMTLFVSAISLISFPYSYAEETVPTLIVLVNPEKANYLIHDYPKLLGSVTDEAGNPVPMAVVKITAARYSAMTTTNLEGKFAFEQKVSSDPGVNLFNVKASKEGYSDGVASTSVFVVDPTPQKTQSSLQQNHVPDQTKMMKVLEQAKQFQEKISAVEKKRQELQAQQQSIQQQREIVYSNLVEDLVKLDLQTIPNTPRNAFEAFLTTIDEGVHAIFWSKFELTEKITQEAHQERLQALQNGMSSAEAMKIFQKKAAISRAELIEHNKNIQIQYGLADKSVQEKFDKNGKYID